MPLTLPTHALDNVLSVLSEADAAEQDLGERWYPDAHTLAGELAHSLPAGHPFHGDEYRAAAVLARYSVQTSWPQNVRLARLAYAASQDPATALAGIMATPTLGATRRAVARMLVGGEPVSDVITSQKVSDFLACIADPWNDSAAVIDRHALSIALGRPVVRNEQGMGARLYRSTADVYRAAAGETGLLPLTVQAVSWVVWRNRHAVANHGHHV